MLEGVGGGIILAIVNLLMVFVVLGGLAGVLIVMRRLLQIWEDRQDEVSASTGKSGESREISLAKSEDQHTRKHLAAMTAALQEFTALPPGALRIESIEPLEAPPVSSNQHLAVITAALHHYLATPEGAFQVSSVEALGPAGSVSEEQLRATDPICVAITAALHEYLTTPTGSFRIVRLQPVGMVNTWKMAGRFDSIGVDQN